MIHIFIVNPYAGMSSFASNLRSRLAEFSDLKYFVFNTRYAGNERELVSKIINIFEGEKLRFYCCGGSGTMRNMLSGFESYENFELAFFPCGLTNDFLKVFGKDEERFHNIEELIYGDVIEVDYIKTNHGVALNTFSTGVDSISQNKLEEYRILSIFGQNVPYFLSILRAIFTIKTTEYIVEVDGEKYEGKMDELFFGNGHVLGGKCFFAHQSCVDDGKCIFLAYPSKNIANKIMFLLDTMKDQVDKCYSYAEHGYASKFVIRRKDGQPFTMNYDGELESGNTLYEGEIVRKGLRFVVPKGVKI